MVYFEDYRNKQVTSIGLPLALVVSDFARSWTTDGTFVATGMADRAPLEPMPWWSLGRDDRADLQQANVRQERRNGIGGGVRGTLRSKPDRIQTQCFRRDNVSGRTIADEEHAGVQRKIAQRASE
jgi:hypothetical protein